MSVVIVFRQEKIVSERVVEKIHADFGLNNTMEAERRDFGKWKTGSVWVSLEKIGEE